MLFASFFNTFLNKTVIYLSMVIKGKHNIFQLFSIMDRVYVTDEREQKNFASIMISLKKVLCDPNFTYTNQYEL